MNNLRNILEKITYYFKEKRMADFFLQHFVLLFVPVAWLGNIISFLRNPIPAWFFFALNCYFIYFPEFAKLQEGQTYFWFFVFTLFYGVYLIGYKYSEKIREAEEHTIVKIISYALYTFWIIGLGLSAAIDFILFLVFVSVLIKKI